MTSRVEPSISSSDATPASDEIRAAWKSAALSLAACLVVLGYLFWDPIIAAVRVWIESATFNHCFLIIPIAGYLLWERREILHVAKPSPTIPLPFLAVLLGSAAWLVASTASVLEIQQFALLGIIECLLLAILGWRVFWALLFPLLYLILLVPTGEQFVPLLQDVTTVFSVAGLNLIGIPNFVDGVFISIPTGDFHVAEACAGLRFLIASVAYGFLFAALMYRSWTRRVVFVVASLVVPIIANGFRALGIILLAHYSDHKIAAGADHLVYGWGFFAAVTLFLTWVGLRYRDAPDRWQAPAWARVERARPRGTPASIAIAGLLVTIAAAWGPAYAAYLGFRASPTDLTVAAPTVRSPWQRVDQVANWRPSFVNPSAERHQRYERADGRGVDMHIVFYGDQRKGAELISFDNQLQVEPWARVSDARRTLAIDGAPLAVNQRRLIQGRARRVIWSWYWVDRSFTADTIGVKLRQLRGKLLTGERAAAAVMLSVEAPSDAEANAILDDFLAHVGTFGPLLDDAARAVLAKR